MLCGASGGVGAAGEGKGAGGASGMPGAGQNSRLPLLLEMLTELQSRSEQSACLQHFCDA